MSTWPIDVDVDVDVKLENGQHVKVSEEVRPNIDKILRGQIPAP